MVVLPRPPKPHFLQSPLPWVHPRLQAELPGNRCSLSALLVETLETARLINDIRLIQERYAWFLDGVFSDAIFEKKKGQRKIPLAPMIRSHGYEAFISGVSLGESPETDAPPVKT